MLGTPGHIFNFWFVWIERLPAWLRKPLVGCVVCLTGEVLFHFYWITHLQGFQFHFDIYSHAPLRLAGQFIDYKIIDQLFYPAAGIILATIYTNLYDRFETH
jgi:hypothetical protein